MAIAAGNGGGTGAYQCFRVGLQTNELRQRRLAHGPPLVGSVKALLDPFEVFPDGPVIVFVAEGAVEAPQTLEPGFERGLGMTRLEMPRLEIIEDGAAQVKVEDGS